MSNVIPSRSPSRRYQDFLSPLPEDKQRFLLERFNRLSPAKQRASLEQLLSESEETRAGALQILASVRMNRVLEFRDFLLTARRTSSSGERPGTYSQREIRDFLELVGDPAKLDDQERGVVWDVLSATRNKTIGTNRIASDALLDFLNSSAQA